MSEEKSPLAMIVELMVFAPLGAAFLLRDQLPKLSQTGRDRAEARVRMAKMVGQFAVSAGKKELDRRLESFRSAAQASPTTPTESGTTEARPSGSVRPDTASTTATVAPPGGAETAATGRPNLDMDGPAPSVEQLAIPGYDSLAASQVVERLASLSPAELELVRRYESSARHRRTILHRIDQLVA